MRDGFEELKWMLQSYNRKNNLKVIFIAVACALAVVAVIAAIVCFVRGGCCCDIFDDGEFEDDFDEDNDDFEE